MLQGNSSLLVLAALECRPHSGTPCHHSAWCQKPELIGLGQPLVSPRRAEETKPESRRVPTPEDSGKAVLVYLCHSDPAVPRVPHSGPSSLGLVMNVLPASPSPASQTEI